MSKERHISFTQGGKTFHLWRARLRDEMPAADSQHGNPWLWWGRRDGEDIELCGVKTLREAKEHFGIRI